MRKFLFLGFFITAPSSVYCFEQRLVPQSTRLVDLEHCTYDNLKLNSIGSLVGFIRRNPKEINGKKQEKNK